MMTKDTGIYGAGAGMIQTGGFGARLFGYAIFYIPVTLMLFFAAIFIEEQHKFAPTGIKFIDITLFLSFVALIPALVLSFWEKSIRKFRRKNGLSVYGNIAKELEQREINERVAKEHKAFVANGITREGVEKNDIGYWFGLLQKGAISKEEYNLKKSELMAG